MRQKLENYLYQIWYADTKVPWYLHLLSSVFNRLRLLRQFFFKRGWLKSIKDETPVLVIGNITVGGTGKTPLVLFLIEELRKQELKVGVISRGYGGSFDNKNSMVISGLNTAAEIGDEAFMIYQRSQVPFAVGRNRVQAAQLLKRHHPELDLIVSDDGLQHYKMQRTLEIVIIDGQRGFGNMQLLPAGPLREPLSRLQSVDLLLSNGLAQHDSLNAYETLQFNLFPAYFRRLNRPNEFSDFQAFYGKTLHAFAGIGNPERFFKLLLSHGVDVIEHPLSDHGVMPEQFFQDHRDEIIVMTEKDAVKYPHISSGKVWYLPVDVQMQEATKKQFLAVILEKLKGAMV